MAEKESKMRVVLKLGGQAYIDRGHTLEPRLIESVLTSTHDLCFRANYKKIMHTQCKSQFYYVNVRGSTLPWLCINLI